MIRTIALGLASFLVLGDPLSAGEVSKFAAGGPFRRPAPGQVERQVTVRPIEAPVPEANGRQNPNLEASATSCVAPSFVPGTETPVDDATDVGLETTLKIEVHGSWPIRVELSLSEDDCFPAWSWPVQAWDWASYQLFLNPGTTYRWRAKATNACGEAATVCRTFTSTACGPRFLSRVGDGPVTDTVLSGLRAFVVTPNEVGVVDLSDPSQARRVASVALPGGGSYPAVLAGSFLYVSGWAEVGVRVVDLADPSSPAFRGTLPWLYVLAGSPGLLLVFSDLGETALFDTTNPVSPVRRGSISVDGPAVFRGSWLFVGNWSGGEGEVWDVSDPDHPARVWHESGLGDQIAVDGDLLVSAGLVGESFRVWSAADPTNLQLLAVVPNLADGRPSIAGLDGARLVLGRGASKELWDLSIPASPSLLASLQGSGFVYHANAMRTVDTPADELAGPRFFDIADPLHVAEVPLAEWGPSLDVRFAGEAMFVAARERGLVVWDVTNPSLPRERGTLSLASGTLAWALDLDGSTLLVVAAEGADGSSSTAWLVDTADPWDPQVLGSITGLAKNMSPRLSQGRLYGVDSAGLFGVWDVSNPVSPQRLGTLTSPVLGPQGTIAVAEATVLVSFEQTSDILDVTNPSTPFRAGSLPTQPEYELFPIAPLAVLSGSRALVGTNYLQCPVPSCGGPTGLSTGLYDLSSPSAPILESLLDGAPAVLPSPGLGYDRLGYGGGATSRGMVVFEGGTAVNPAFWSPGELAVFDLGRGLPMEPKARIQTESSANGFVVNDSGTLAAAPTMFGTELYDVTTCTATPPPIVVVRLSPGGPVGLCRSPLGSTPSTTLTASVTTSPSGACPGVFRFQWYDDGRSIPGATNSSYSTSTHLGAGEHVYTAIATCGANASLSATSEKVRVEVATASPTAISGVRLSKSAYSQQITWTDQPAVTRYEVRSDTNPSGTFATFVGSATTGTSGVWWGASSEPDLFFQVRAIDGCGTGP